ncbi:hypothetical protein BDN70DRAFT_911461 [Pholiota conissans]|uniref:DUF6534 domain-containing protein n=1 Tax=Pholiota conissans TaxID=109636 RepID=A0A9P6CWF3_9AGAR|nr:hypothetical protein BDN70DRAFT_911461 [Pholiota conissans]
MATPASSIDDISLVGGPLLVGSVFNAFLFGMCVVQCVTYWEHQRGDSALIKSLVVWSIFLDTVHTCSLLDMLWEYFVNNFSRPSFLMTVLWPFSSTPIFTTFTSFPIQLYLSWRIRRFSRCKRVFVVLCTLSAAQSTLGILVSVSAYKNANLATYSRLIPLVDTWQVMAVIADLSLTVFLCYYLKKNRTGQKRSDNVISRVISASVETAAVGAFFCIMDLIMFTALPDTNFHVIFAFPMGRIYTNILLRTLNSRSSLRAEFEGPMSIPDIALDQSSHNEISTPPTANRVQDNIGSISVSVNVFNAADLSNSVPWQEMQAISNKIIGIKDIESQRNSDRV